MAAVTVKRSSNWKPLTDIKGGAVKVGWFPSARYNDEHRTPVAAVAAQNEYGNPNARIPARPFIRPAIADNTVKWKSIAADGMRSVVRGKTQAAKVLEVLGEVIKEDIQYSITRVYSPALAQSTVDARISRRANHSGRYSAVQARSITKPLIDTGYMQATVSYEITRK